MMNLFTNMFGNMIIGPSLEDAKELVDDALAISEANDEAAQALETAGSDLLGKVQGLYRDAGQIDSAPATVRDALLLSLSRLAISSSPSCGEGTGEVARGGTHVSSRLFQGTVRCTYHSTIQCRGPPLPAVTLPPHPSPWKRRERMNIHAF
jgi:hypothetical protein